MPAQKDTPTKGILLYFAFRNLNNSARNIWTDFSFFLFSLLQFKDRIDDIVKPNHDDYYLRKWLKARNFDVDKAETMYRTVQ